MYDNVDNEKKNIKTKYNQYTLGLEDFNSPFLKKFIKNDGLLYQKNSKKALVGLFE